MARASPFVPFSWFGHGGVRSVSFTRALEAGNLEYLQEHTDDLQDWTEVMETAVKHGHLHIVHWAVQSQRTTVLANAGSLMCFAIRKTQVEILRYLVQCAAACVSQPCPDQSPLELALQSGSKLCVRAMSEEWLVAKRNTPHLEFGSHRAVQQAISQRLFFLFPHILQYPAEMQDTADMMAELARVWPEDEAAARNALRDLKRSKWRTQRLQGSLLNRVLADDACSDMALEEVRANAKSVLFATWSRSLTDAIPRDTVAMDSLHQAWKLLLPSDVPEVGTVSPALSSLFDEHLLLPNREVRDKLRVLGLRPFDPERALQEIVTLLTEMDDIATVHATLQTCDPEFKLPVDTVLLPLIRTRCVMQVDFLVQQHLTQLSSGPCSLTKEDIDFLRNVESSTVSTLLHDGHLCGLDILDDARRAGVARFKWLLVSYMLHISDWHTRAVIESILLRDVPVVLLLNEHVGPSHVVFQRTDRVFHRSDVDFLLDHACSNLLQACARERVGDMHLLDALLCHRGFSVTLLEALLNLYDNGQGVPRPGTAFTEAVCRQNWPAIKVMQSFSDVTWRLINERLEDSDIRCVVQLPAKFVLSQAFASKETPQEKTHHPYASSRWTRDTVAARFAYEVGLAGSLELFAWSLQLATRDTIRHALLTGIIDSYAPEKLRLYLKAQLHVTSRHILRALWNASQPGRELLDVFLQEGNSADDWTAMCPSSPCTMDCECAYKWRMWQGVLLEHDPLYFALRAVPIALEALKDPPCEGTVLQMLKHVPWDTLEPNRKTELLNRLVQAKLYTVVAELVMDDTHRLHLVTAYPGLVKAYPVLREIAFRVLPFPQSVLLVVLRFVE